MELFQLDQPLLLSPNHPDHPRQYHLAETGVYFSVPSHVQALKLLAQASHETVVWQAVRDTNVLDPLLNLGYQQGQIFVPVDQKVSRFIARSSIRIAVIGMGMYFTTALAFLSALAVLAERLHRYFRQVEIDLFQRHLDKTLPVFHQSPCISRLYQLPDTIQKLQTYDAYVSFDRIFLNPAFYQRPLTDFFLESLSIPADTIPAASKKITYRVDPVLLDKLRAVLHQKGILNQQLLVLAFRSGSITRSMPVEIATQLIEQLLALSEYTIVVFNEIGFIDHPRVVRLGWLNQQFDHLAGLCQLASAIVSVDSAALYLADAFRIPAVGLFTSARASDRLTYFPTVNGIDLTSPNHPIHAVHYAQHAAHNALSIGVWHQQDLEQLTHQILELLR